MVLTATTMITPLLQDLGLSLNEAKIYESLVTYGGSGVSPIALRANVHRRNAYDTIRRLVEKGLVYEIFKEGETIYEPVQPGKLMELIQEKEMKLAAEMPRLVATFNKNRIQQRAYIYTGVEGVKNYMRTALEAGEDI